MTGKQMLNCSVRRVVEHLSDFFVLSLLSHRLFDFKVQHLFYKDLISFYRVLHRHYQTQHLQYFFFGFVPDGER